jgi:hypothetical protein
MRLRPHAAEGRLCTTCFKCSSIEEEVKYCSSEKKVYESVNYRENRDALAREAAGGSVFHYSCCDSLSYCSLECKEKDYRDGHWLLCRERDTSMSNNSVEFSQVLKSSSQGNRLEMAVTLFGSLILRDLQLNDDKICDDDEDIVEMSSDDAPRDIWAAFGSTWPLSATSERGMMGSDEYDSSDIFVLLQGMILYEKIEVLEHIIASSSQSRKRKQRQNRDDLLSRLERDVVTLQHWMTVFNVVMQYSLDVSLESPLLEFIEKMPESDEKVTALEEKVWSLVFSLQSSLSIPVNRPNNDILNGNPLEIFVSKNNDSSGRKKATALEAVDTLKSMSIRALLLSKSLREFPHSCLPTHHVHVSLKERMDTMTRRYVNFEISPVRLSENDAPSSPPPSGSTINWLGPAVSLDNLSRRERELKQRYGELFECQYCALCAYEVMKSGNRSLKEAGMVMMMPLVYHQMDRQEFKDAETLLRQLIIKDEYGHEAGEAYHALGACLLNQGKWSEAYAVWSKGAAAAPQHKRLNEIAAKLKAFDLKSVQDLGNEKIYVKCHMLKVPGGSVVVKEPRASTSTILLSESTVVDSKKCEWLVSVAEEHALMKGWSTQRHYGAPTTDIPLSSLPLPVLEWFKKFFVTKVITLLKNQYFRPEEQGKAVVAIHDAFLVKYSAKGGQRYLPEHTDESSHSFILALNPDTDFEGGGTYFTRLGAAI